VWRRIDLHLHTPASVDYQDPDISYLDILRKAEARGADLIAFTDHNSVRGYANLWREIEDLELLEALERLSTAEQRRLDEYRRILKTIRVLPGFELSATFGFHILAIFPEGTSIRTLEHILLELNVPEEKLDLGTSEVGATVDVLTAYETLHEAGALVIPAHVNSTHGVAMQNLPFGGQTKIAFTQNPYIDALEATDLESTSRRSTARFFNGSKPEYPRRMHIIQGSDAHRLNRDPNRESNLGVGDRMTEVLVPDVSFAALQELFRSEHFNRTRPFRAEHHPYDFIRMARSEGETIVQAFHEKMPLRRGRQSPILRDAAAFANGNGGTIFIGLSASPKDPVVGVEDAAEQAGLLAEDIARYITPPIAGTIDIQETDRKQIIVIQVPTGADKPYAVLPGTIFVRQEGETTIAVRDEIVQLVKSSLEQPPGELPELVGEQASAAKPAAQHEHEHERTRHSRRRRSRHERPATEQAQPEEQAVAQEEPAQATTPEAVSQQQGQPRELPPPPSVDLSPVDAIPYPRTGVEVVASSPGEDVTYHSMRDLRNLKVVHNVTRDSARRLWRYAITQCELHSPHQETIHWVGDRGFWKSYKPRGGDVRYNLVFRHDDDLHVFYGVTDEGLDDDWRTVIPERLLQKPNGEQQDGVEADEQTADHEQEQTQAPAAVEHASEAQVVETPPVEPVGAAPAPHAEPAPAAEPESAPAIEAEPVAEVVATPKTPEAEAEQHQEEKPKPVRRRRAPAKKKVTEPAPEEAQPKAAEEAESAAAADAPTASQAEASTETEAEPVPVKKPVRRRRTTKKAATEEAPASEPAEPDKASESQD
jgi:hypothetical protein